MRPERRHPLRVHRPLRSSTGSIHRELEKVKFPEFFGAPDGAATEAWLENMAMCFALHNYTSNRSSIYFKIIDQSIEKLYRH
jgi:hypothetical protein